MGSDKIHTHKAIIPSLRIVRDLVNGVTVIVPGKIKVLIRLPDGTFCLFPLHGKVFPLHLLQVLHDALFASGKI